MSSELSKNNQHFYKTTGHGCNYSLLDKSGITLFFAVVSPETQGDKRDQVLSAIERLDVILKKEHLEGSVISHNVFLKDIGDKQLIRQLLLDYYGDNLPVLTYIPQAPCEKDVPFLFEVSAMKGENQHIRVLRLSEGAVAVDTSDYSLGFFGEITPDDPPYGAYNRSLCAFERMKEIVEKSGFKLPHLLRTWLYQGNITLPEGDTQRYKELNRARTDFFQDLRFLQKFAVQKDKIIYPASTGIGGNGVDITMAALALESDSDSVKTIPLENPSQTPAFDYQAVYSPQSPKFSRAMALVTGKNCNIYISGTASIVDSETKFAGDPQKQTLQTLENIRVLIAKENLAAHGIEGFDADLTDLAAVRVYIKRPEDYSVIRPICDKTFCGTPVIYTHADVCRDDLLVEIEGLAACRRLDDSSASLK